MGVKYLSRMTVILFLGLVSLFASDLQASWLTDSSPENTVTVRYRLAVAANISTAAVVIDLSDTTGYPHKETGELLVSGWRVEIDKVAASTTTVKLGVVNFVDASTGSVTWFYAKEQALSVSNTDIRDVINLEPNFLRLRVNGASGQADGATPYLLSSDKTAGSSTYQTDVVLPAPNTNGYVAPGPGDLVLSCANGTGAITINLTVQYQARRR